MNAMVTMIATMDLMKQIAVSVACIVLPVFVIVNAFQAAGECRQQLQNVTNIKKTKKHTVSPWSIYIW